MSGGRKMLITFVLAAAAFAYQYVRSPSFRRQCGSVFAEWRGSGRGHTPSPLRGTPPVSVGELKEGGNGRDARSPSQGELKGGGNGRDARSPSRGELKRGGNWDNLDLGVPGKCDQVIEREGYALGYVEAWEQQIGRAHV